MHWIAQYIFISLAWLSTDATKSESPKARLPIITWSCPFDLLLATNQRSNPHPVAFLPVLLNVPLEILDGADARPLFKAQELGMCVAKPVILQQLKFLCFQAHNDVNPFAGRESQYLPCPTPL